MKDKESAGPSGAKPRRLDAAVRELFGLSWGDARQRIYRGKIFLRDAVCTDIGAPVGPDDEVRYVEDARRERPEDVLLPKEAFRWIDRDIVVVEKPADLLTVPYETEDRVTLNRLIQAVLARREKHNSRGSRAARPPVLVVHRLDKGTSGLLVFARNPDALRGLKEQFRDHTTERRYLALAHGIVRPGRYVSHQVSNRGDGIRGSVEQSPARLQRRLGPGKEAITHVEVIEAYENATLISCRLETGRTNQIRIHLSEAGHPLVGENIYLRGYTGKIIPSPRLCLHARTLGFIHPKTGEKMSFTTDIPDEMQKIIDSMGPPRKVSRPRNRAVGSAAHPIKRKKRKVAMAKKDDSQAGKAKKNS